MNEIKDRLVQIASNMQKVYAAGQIQGVLPENLPTYTGSSDGWGYELHIIAEKLLDVYNAGVNGTAPEEGMTVFVTTTNADDPNGNHTYTITNGDKTWEYLTYEVDWWNCDSRANPYEIIKIDNTKPTTISVIDTSSTNYGFGIYNGDTEIYNTGYWSTHKRVWTYTIAAGVVFDEIRLMNMY